MIPSMNTVHEEWRPILSCALDDVSSEYLNALQTDPNWLPGLGQLFAAFSHPLSSIRYILFGESPYPRAHSANGYAFWDAAVGELWSETGLSKEVNRATSLRNLIKMLLFARGDLTSDFSQPAIAALDKSQYCQTAKELFCSLINHGFLLLNASLVYSEKKVIYHAKHWRPLMSGLLQALARSRPDIQLILLGKVATLIPDTHLFSTVVAEHPYNITFITNPVMVNFFRPLDVLHR